MSRGDELVHLDDVTKIFYTDEIETHALSGIHLTIDEGEYVSIAGPSGGGKSTLLSILGLLDTPSTGEYRLSRYSPVLGVSSNPRIERSVDLPPPDGPAIETYSPSSMVR